MRRQDLLLICATAGAGLIAVTTHTNHPLVSSAAVFFTAASAYLAKSPISKGRKSDENDTKK